LLIKL